MPIFRVDVQIVGTAYIKAPSVRIAATIANALKDSTLMVQEAVNEGESDVPISGRRFTDPELPILSLSPAMTIHGVWPDAEPEDVDD